MNKIPPSLNWLIKKRARISGEIIKTRKALKKVQDLVDRLIVLEANLEVIDKSLNLHEIKIDIDLIKPIRPKGNIGFPKGFISKHVMNYLRLHDGDNPIPKTEIVDYIIQLHNLQFNKNLPYVIFADAVKQVLCRNQRAGRVVRIHNPITTKVGLWKIKK